MSELATKINKFNGGMTSNARSGNAEACRVIKHFDNYSLDSKLTPYRSMEVDAVVESSLDTLRITKMLVANAKLYGFGAVSDVDSHAKVYVKSTGADPTTAWTTASGTATSASGGALSDVLFLAYHNYLYGGNSTGIWKYGDITSGGGEAFTYNEYTTHGATAQGLVHSKDDIMYIPSNNLILVNNSGSWSVGLTLPTNSVVNCICEYGNYLAIACDQADGTSVVYLWDRDSSLSTLSEKIDWGVGSLKLIECIGGVLTGISVSSAGLNSISPEVLFKYYSGLTVIIFEQFATSLATIKADKQKFNDVFYFLAEMTINSVVLKGLWKIFKKADGKLTVSFDRLVRNDTALNAGGLKGFLRWGDYVFIAHLIPTNSAYSIYRTNDQEIYTATSVYESKIFNAVPGAGGRRFGDSTLSKKLIGVSVSTEPLPANGSVSLYYKIDSETSWTLIFTNTTDNSISHSAVKIESSGANLPQHKEIQFRIESTGGAEITELDFLIELIPKRPY